MDAINERDCQPCTACCEGWLDIKTTEVQAHLGKPCTHCTGQGCNIYEARPHEPCRTFHCAWRQQDTLLPHNMRPDLSGAIVTLDQVQWQGQSVIVAVATGTRVPSRTFHWLCSFAKLTGRQLVVIEFKKEAGKLNGDFDLRTPGPKEFRQVMVTYFAEKGFASTGVSTQRRVIELVAL